MLKYSKKVNGTYYVVEAVPESKYKKFWVVSAYMEKATGGTQAPNANGPGNTPDASLASNPIAFNNSIPTSQNTVKGKTVGPLGLDVAMSEQLRQLQEVYAKQQQQGELERLFLKGFNTDYGEENTLTNLLKNNKKVRYHGSSFKSISAKVVNSLLNSSRGYSPMQLLILFPETPIMVK